MLFVYKGRWYARYWVVNEKGQRKRVKKGTGIRCPTDEHGEPDVRSRKYADSRRLAEEAERQLHRSAQLVASGLASPEVPKVSLEKAFRELIQLKSLMCAPATLQIVEDKAGNAFDHFGPDTDIGSIDGRAIAQFAASMMEQKYAPGTVDRALRHLVEAIALYHPRPERPKLGRVYRPRERFLEPEEFESMVRAADLHATRSGRTALAGRRDWIIMNACMGVSHGRLVQVNFDDIRLADNLLLVQHAGKTKNGISIHPRCRPILEARRGLSPPFPPWTSMPKRIKELCQAIGANAPTPQNVDQLLEVWEERAAKVQVVSKRDYLIMYTHMGLTYSELYKIGTGDIDWDGNQVFVRGTKAEKRARAIPMTHEVREVLNARKGRGEMFPTWGNSNMHRDLNLFATIADLEELSANDLRRTFATWLARDGVPMLHLMNLMGHSSLKMLVEVYARVERGQHLHAAIAKIPRLSSH